LARARAPCTYIRTDYRDRRQPLSARSLAQVHVGDTVAVQITESNGLATVVSLQDQSSP
jgi:hypothetical protein